MIFQVYQLESSENESDGAWYDDAFPDAKIRAAPGVPKIEIEPDSKRKTKRKAKERDANDVKSGIPSSSKTQDGLPMIRGR